MTYFHTNNEMKIWQNFTAEVTHMNPNPTLSIRYIWIIIERDEITDTYDGNISVI